MNDNDILNQRLTKAQADYENQLMQSDQLAGENSQKNTELKLKESEISSLKADIARITKLREGLQRRLRTVEEQKQEVESSREALRQQITAFERGEGLRVPCCAVLRYCDAHACRAGVSTEAS